MAIKPSEALNYITDTVKKDISELEEAIDLYLNENYNGEPIVVFIKELTVDTKKFTNDFFNYKATTELVKRYSNDWIVEKGFKAPRGTCFSFTDVLTKTDNAIVSLNEGSSDISFLTV